MFTLQRLHGTHNAEEGKQGKGAAGHAGLVGAVEHYMEEAPYLSVYTAEAKMDAGLKMYSTVAIHAHRLLVRTYGLCRRRG